MHQAVAINYLYTITHYARRTLHDTNWCLPVSLCM
jgi:hypothetical protein